MKGYRENLKKFIEYVFSKYKKDNEVQNFQSVYFVQEKRRQRRAEKGRVQSGEPKSVRIGSDTAKLCRKLVLLERNRELAFTHVETEHMKELNKAYEDLTASENRGE